MIASVKSLVTDPSSQAAVQRPGAEAGDFAAVARSVAAGDLEAARSALRASASSAGATATLSQSLDAGNLAAARLALLQLGADPYMTAAGPSSQPRDGAPFLPDPSPVPIAPITAPPTDAKIALGREVAPFLPDPSAVPIAPSTPLRTDSNIAGAGDTGPAQAGAAASAGHATAMVVADAGALASGSSASYSISDVMLALATGNAGSIPADVINLYGPGGARYDPAAIMDAYRNSDIGKAQMAMFAWMTRPA